MKKILLSMMACAALCACTNDDIALNDGLLSKSDDGEKVYVKLSLSMADATRGTRADEGTGEGTGNSTETTTTENDDYVTSKDSIEYAKDYESTIDSMNIVLTYADETTSTETVVAVADVSNQTTNWTKMIGVSGDAYIISFQQQELIDYAGKQVNVYVYCNQEYQASTVTSTDATTFNADAKWTVTDPSKESTGDTGTGTSTTVTPWTSGSFYMSSAVAHSYQLPSAGDMTTIYNTEANPLDLGTVYVDRNVARFDIKDGAPNASTSPFTYTITETTTDEGATSTAATGGEGSYSLVLSEVALINMSKEFYALRHMAANSNTDGKDAADLQKVTLLTKEVTNNWVIDTDAEAKSKWTSTSTSTSSDTPTFYYSMDKPSEWDWSSLSDIVDSKSGIPDNDEEWNSDKDKDKDKDKGDYYIWRYATENTIPSVDQQQHGLTTGVVFKAEIKGSDENTSLGGDGDTKGRVYVFQNVLYPSWDAVKAAATGSEGTIDTDSSIGYAYQAVMDAWEKSQSSGGGNTEATFDEYNADVTTAMAEVGFTGYSPTTEEGEGNDATTHYYCYYYYWNRHNDNFNDGVMGIMEFGVVRNNVYKLSVTDILKYGHPLPQDPDSEEPGDPDPDPVNPGTPDEETNIYMKVEVQVLPWVVRINNITF